ncbi:Ribonuclease HIII [Methylacidimicrobium sp. AP8]|uniref:ribonuclease HIII n=1 Tax=Methylacidimicrobium sp. AP8 TaxID=2730359 RepID=UPI0018C14115|nr:ribonuclease HIII [Methylacidimicrobium sp. AP8]CAB4244181.1 Ribonuclease HIII [Methylacidimicrobium sp. AP8]
MLPFLARTILRSKDFFSSGGAGSCPPPPPPSTFSFSLAPEQINELRERLRQKGFEMRSLPHGLFDARGPSLVVRAYRTGTVLIQGRAAADFVEMFLEPEILREVRIGPPETGKPEDDSPHAGSDECGKGDFFGPLVVAAVYVDPQTAPALRRLGVRDSKEIKSDAQAVRLGEEIRKAVRGRCAVVAIGPPKYNELYARFGNLNRLLAWAHAAALAEIARKVPSCPRALVDQFAKAPVLDRAIRQQGLSLRVDQKPRAESDIAVAAASLLARMEFLRRLVLLGKEAGRTLPKGASSPVLAAAQEIVRSQGADRLRALAKVHFRTFGRAAAVGASLEMRSSGPPEERVSPPLLRPSPEQV